MCLTVCRRGYAVTGRRQGWQLRMHWPISRLKLRDANSKVWTFLCMLLQSFSSFFTLEESDI